MMWIKTRGYITAILAITFLLGVSSCNRNGNRKVIKAADYGLEEGTDATPLIRNLMDTCRMLGVKELELPRGTFHFYPDRAGEEYCAISNNDNGLKRIAFLVENMSEFHLKGDSTRLIFHGNMVPVVIRNSSHVKLSGFSIDWQRPFQSEATVVDVNPSAGTFDIAISPHYPYKIKDHELLFTGEGWEQDIQKNLFFDPKTGATVYKVNDYKLDPWNPRLRNEYSAKEIESGLVRIYDTISPLPQKGWIWVSKGGKEPERYSPAIWMYKAFNVDVEGVSIYNSGGMGLVAERSGDITMRHLTVSPSPGSGRIVSTSADATHFVSCKGSIRFDHCLFESMLDDATNVHGIYTVFKGFADKHTIGVQTMHYQQRGFDFADPGDAVQFIDRNTLLPYLTLNVRKVTRVNSEYTLLEFNEDVTGLVRANTAVENMNWYPDVIMQNCTVRKNRARSILISTRGHVLVENNYFSSMMAGILISGDANFWYESGAVADVTIRDNTFEDCCTGAKNQAVILIEPVIKNPGEEDRTYHKNITIENNTIRTFDRNLIRATSVSNLVIKDNHFFQTHTFPPIYPGKKEIELNHSRDVTVSGNTFEGDHVAEIMTDSQSRRGLTIENNRNMNLIDSRKP